MTPLGGKYYDPIFQKRKQRLSLRNIPNLTWPECVGNKTEVQLCLISKPVHFELHVTAGQDRKLALGELIASLGELIASLEKGW